MRFSLHGLVRGTLFAVVSLLVFGSTPSIHMAAGEEGPGEPVSKVRWIHRALDPVLVRGEEMQDFLGADIGALRVFSKTHGRIEPIPHQIDKRDRDGHYIFRDDRKASYGRSAGGLQEWDELIFMARDLGDRVGSLEEPPWKESSGLRQGLEIEVTDPVSRAKAWAYVFSFEHPPARSTTDYVHYCTEEDVLTTPAYSIGFKNPKIRTSMNYTALRGPEGGVGKDLIDRFKARADATFLWGFIRFHKDETDFRSRVVDTIDGPLRVIRKAEYSLRIMWNIPTPWAEVYTYYYRNFIELPTKLNIPFDIGYLVSEISGRVSLDFNKQVSGSIFYSPRNPEGAVLDGIMSPSELVLDAGSFPWAVVDCPHGAFVFRVIMDKRLPVALSLFYRDEALEEDAPEENPGQYGNLGWRIGNMEAIEKGRYQYRTLIYFPDRFQKGDERRCIDVEDSPLRIRVSGWRNQARHPDPD